MPIRLPINEPAHLKQADAIAAAAEMGWTLAFSSNKWGWNGGTITGLTRTNDPSYYGYQYQGTPTTVGNYVLAVDSLSSSGSSNASYSYTVEVYDPSYVEPEPEPEPEDPGTEPPAVPAPSDTVAAFLGRPDDEQTKTLASVHWPIMVEYVHGYTGGRGFSEAGDPLPGVNAVLITATARSVMNPEALSYFTLGDYSERPAMTAGWTLHELGVLRRYRRLTNRDGA